MNENSDKHYEDAVFFWDSARPPRVTISNSFDFRPVPQDVLPDFRWAREKVSAYCDRLNDLVEEYGSPGSPRRLRRYLSRQFDRTLRKANAICVSHRVNYIFKSECHAAV